MKQRILVAVVTALIFSAGFFAGTWHELHRPLPPPPGPLMGEFTRLRNPPGHPPPPPPTRAELFAEVEHLRPQIEAFQQRMDEIDNQFESDLELILTPEQRTANAERLKRRSEFHNTNDTRSLTDERLMRLMQVPYWMLFRVVSLQAGLDDLNRDLKFDDTQRDQVRDLLRVRREKFMALMDSTPPPSLTLMNLAPYVQRLAPAPSPSPKK